jgi:hypothetical protein
MLSREDVLQYLPPFNNVTKIANWGQSIKSIKKEIVDAHGKYETDYDVIYSLFDTGEVYSACRGLWEFCKYNLKYKVESNEEQSVKSPTAILQPEAKIDCKHYSLFIGGVLDAIKHHENESWDWCYRFVSDKPDKIICHVFIVVKLADGTEINIDPVLGSFNEKCNWTNIKDEKPMPVYSISGVGAVDPASPAITIEERGIAEASFLMMVQRNDFSYKTILNSNRETLYGPVRAWYVSQGFDFNLLLNFLK